MSKIYTVFDYLLEHAEELFLDAARVAVHASNHQVDRTFFLLSSEKFSLAPGVKAVSLWVGHELLDFLWFHHLSVTGNTPAQALAVSVAMGTSGSDPMAGKSVEFFEPEHETDAATTERIVREQLEFLKGQLID